MRSALIVLICKTACRTAPASEEMGAAVMAEEEDQQIYGSDRGAMKNAPLRIVRPF